MPPKKRTAQQWAKRIGPKAAYCLYCQPYVDHEYMWVLGDKVPMDEFLSAQGVPEELWSEATKRLHCGNCGASLQDAEEVGLKTQVELAADKKWHRWRLEYAPKLKSFVKWLERYPYLGVHHPIGREFFEQVGSFPDCIYTRKEWWRARPAEEGATMTSAQMGPPPTPPKTEGRYSHHGQRVVYLASSKEDAAAEVLKSSAGSVWVQRFKVLNRDRFLDLTRSDSHDDIAAAPMLLAGLAWTEAHMIPDDPNSEWKPQYFLPRFIADCARKHGFRGIVFGSPKHYGQNLVLLKWKASDLVAMGAPSLMKWQASNSDESPF